MVSMNLGTLNVQELEFILSQNMTNLNVSNGYSKYIDYK